MRLIAATVLTVVLALPVRASEAIDRLADAMRLEEVVTILREEGLRYGETLDAEMLEGSGGQVFAAQVKTIYDTARMTRALRGALAERLNEEELVAAISFFGSDLGQTILKLENAARRAFAEPEIEEMAFEAARDMDKKQPMYRMIDEYIRINELVPRNVRGAISSDYYFYLGLADGQGTPRDDEAVLSELIENRGETEAETRKWVYGFLLFAYSPLSGAQMQGNLDFAASDAGRAINEALFEGFDDLYDGISYDLGRAVGVALGATDL
ncbi:DUF2059 domain-containing protein [Ruegeria marina]|uniref:DUF2059 domain-containing protein n=1 Tax=Ruegeria marina TaxID=639004 RepID=A0A1G6IU05_9RHOB|nr:DUF2059 domain-containing protein [Ruegeria marina]SDC09256.1 hypothetical protein SAMN04488239_101190 [Ruegeria marina]